MIELNSICKVFKSKNIETHALSKIDLRIRENEYFVITGQSGCGKSTLLSVLGLLDTPTSGSYSLAGHKVDGLNESNLAHIRNKHIGFVFQSFHLIGDMSVYENVMLPLSYRRDLKKERLSTMVDKALDRVGMTHRKNHYPSELSGGQQQRVAIARAVAGEPDLLLADEPTGNLDTENSTQIMELLDTLYDSGTTVGLITHETVFSSRITKLIKLLDGKIVQNDCIK